MAKQSSEEWVRRCLLDQDKGAPCTGFALVHLQAGGHTTELHVKPLPDKIPIESADTIAELFEGIAVNHAEGLAGAQQYQLMAFYGGRKTAQAFRPFIKQGYTELEGLSTESPGPTGVMAQSMRHLEAKGMAYIKGVTSLLDMQNRTIELQIQREHGLRAENAALFMGMKDLLMQQMQEGHNRRMEELAYQRTTEERQMFMKAVPGLINSATGKEVFPQSVEDTGHVEALIEAAIRKGPAGLALLQQLDLPAATQFSLASRFQRALAERENAALARSPHHGNGIDPEHDVNGGPLQ